MLDKVIFLDRDGVINQDSPDYIKGWSEFEFISGSVEAVRDVENWYPAVVLSIEGDRARIGALDREVEAVVAEHEVTDRQRGRSFPGD